MLYRDSARDYPGGVRALLTRTRVPSMKIFVQYRKTDTALTVQTESSIRGGSVFGEAQGTS